MLIFPDESLCSLCGVAVVGGTCPDAPQTREKCVGCEGMMRIRRRWAGALRAMARDRGRMARAGIVVGSGCDRGPRRVWDFVVRRVARGGRGEGLFDDWVLWGDL